MFILIHPNSHANRVEIVSFSKIYVALNKECLIKSTQYIRGAFGS